MTGRQSDGLNDRSAWQAVDPAELARKNTFPIEPSLVRVSINLELIGKKFHYEATKPAKPDA